MARPPDDVVALASVKFSIPPRRKPCVDRAELVGATASAAPVVAVTAPAGYGKTTFLTEWALSEERTVAWVNLDRFDDDPSALLGSITAALHRAGLFGDFGAPLVGGGNTSPLVNLAPRVAAGVAAETTPFLLVLDDFHEIRSEACHDVLDLLLAAVPAGSQVVAASRSEQPHVPRLRVNGDLVEIGPDQLALDRLGAQQIFAAKGHELSDLAAERLVRRTEGWPAALYLAALVTSEALEPVLDISGDDAYISDYLHREALSRLTDALQSFLVRTSVLERFSAETCNSLLESSSSERTIRDLEASNLFLVPLDRRRSWYRYHPLFREFLLSELRRVEPGSEPTLHRRAAAWFAANDDPESAVAHLFLAGDHDEAIPLVLQNLRRFHNQGRVVTTQHWLDELGPDRIERHAGLAILACWQAALSGDTDVALHVAECLDIAEPGPPQVRAQALALRSALCRDGIDTMTLDAELALSIEPPSSVARPGALTTLGEAHLAAGRTDDGISLIGQAVQLARYPDNSLSLILGLADLAWFAMDRNDWSSAPESVSRAVDLVDSSGTTEAIPALFVDVASARLALHRGDRDRAGSTLAHALRCRAVATYVLPTFAIRLRLRMATVGLALAQADTADDLHRECLTILEHRPDLGALKDAVDDLGRCVASAAEFRRSGPTLSAAELRLLPYLQTHLSFREIGERLYVSRNTISTQAGSAYRKLGVSTRSGAVDEAVRLGLLGA